MYREAVTAMRKIGRDCIEKRINAVTSGEEVPNDILTQMLKSFRESNNPKLHLHVYATSIHVVTEKNVDMESLMDDFVTFYVAGGLVHTVGCETIHVCVRHMIQRSGQETTASTMSFAVILIHQHPEVLHRYTCVCVQCKGADTCSKYTYCMLVC